VGLIAAVIWSVRRANLSDQHAPLAASIAGILVGSFVGPLLATMAVFRLADDVDGVLWMSISPIVGLVVGVLALIIVAIKA
jgi:hypothetical protein